MLDWDAHMTNYKALIKLLKSLKQTENMFGNPTLGKDSKLLICPALSGSFAFMTALKLKCKVDCIHMPTDVSEMSDFDHVKQLLLSEFVETEWSDMLKFKKYQGDSERLQPCFQSHLFITLLSDKRWDFDKY